MQFDTEFTDHTTPDKTISYLGYELARSPKNLLVCVKSGPDGSMVPHELTQRFTTVGMAKQFIDKYLEDKQPNEKSN